MNSATDQPGYPGEGIREREISFENGDTILAGTLFLPPTAGPHPAVAMLQGSGSADRDNFGYFRPIREHFARHGVAALCYDKPGVGGSSGDWREQSFHDRAAEALAATRFLQGQPEIAQRRVGLWGLSQGGWVAPLAASVSGDVAFVVTVSGPGVSPAEQVVYDVETRMRADGRPEEEVARGVAYVNALVGAVRRKESYEAVEASVLREARGEPWYGYFPVPDARLWGFFLRSDPDYDPAHALERVACPVLAVFGELDVLVPAPKSAGIFEGALRRGGNPHFTVRVFPGANHGIGTEDYIDGPEDLAPGYLELMTDWILRRAGRGSG